MREPVSLEEYGEEADRRIRELADQPIDLSALETAPHIAGSLHMAAPGDSISGIMGSSDPGAIGAFMQANDLNDTRMRAGQSYFVPERDSFAAPGAKALGQAGLDGDNELATQRMQDRLDRSMTSIGKTMSGFDPLKGLLATMPETVPRDAPNVGVNQAAEKYHRASTAVGIAGNVLGGFEIQNKTLGLLDGGRAAAKIGIVTRPLGAVLVPLEHGLEGISEVKNGAPIAPVSGCGRKNRRSGNGYSGRDGSRPGSWQPYPGCGFNSRSYRWSGWRMGNRRSSEKDIQRGVRTQSPICHGVVRQISLL